MNKAAFLYKCPRCKKLKTRDHFEGKNGRKTLWCDECRTDSATRNPTRKQYMNKDKSENVPPRRTCAGVSWMKIKCKKRTDDYRCAECWALARGKKLCSANHYTGEEYGGGCG